MMELSFAVSLVLIVYVQSCSSSLIVESPFGKIQGMEMTAKNNKKYVGFQGIPYAKPPVGKLRLAKPEPHPPLDGVFDASKEVNKCPHPPLILSTGQEDCLILNIYMKDVSPKTGPKKKVFVFIHGGMFFSGFSKMYNPGTFVTEQDVIIVIIQYRIGALGFLSTGNDAGPGNYGLWDQALAIKWVKDNIEAFGGDANDIAVGGESAGGASVTLQSISPVMKSVFTRAYPMSGGANSVYGLVLDAQADAVKFAKGCNCWSGSEDAKIDLAESQQIMDCLRERPLEDFTEFFDYGFHRSVFAPRIDGDFLPGHPYELLKNDYYLESVGFFNRTYLVGIDNNEKSIFDVFNQRLYYHIMILENTPDTAKEKMIEEIQNSTRGFYLQSRFGFSVPDKVKAEVKDWYDRRFYKEGLNELMSDLNFLMPAYDLLDAVARSKTTDAYFLYFNHYPAFMKGEHRGSPHGLDLGYWFDFDLENVKGPYPEAKDAFDETDWALKDRFSSLVANFIKTGNPSDAIKDTVPSGWPSYDLQGSHYLDFNPEPSVGRHLERERRRLWVEKIPSMVVAEEARLKHHSHLEL